MDAGKRVILITGSARGIGAGLVREFALMGHHVVINYRSSELAAAALHTEIVDRCGPEASLVVKADVSSSVEVRRMFDAAHQHFGRVDVLINNAGVNRDGAFQEISDEDWSEVLGTVLTGTFFCSREFARRFSGDEGHIINIGAVTAIHGRRNGANYCSARAGVVNLTRCMALELAPRIRVNTVTPGYIDTEEVVRRYELQRPDKLQEALKVIPMGRLGTPQDIFRTINFLVCESTYITGQNFFVDGGKLMH